MFGVAVKKCPETDLDVLKGESFMKKMNQVHKVGRAYAVIAMMALSSFVACSKGQFSSSGADGTLNSGIIGGVDASGTEDYSKTIASLYNVTEGALCTISILSDSIGVTAAHCVDGAAPSSLKIIFGTNLTGTDRQIRQVVGAQITPIYPVRQNQDTNTGDVGVVRFVGGLPAGYHAATVLSNTSVLQTGATVTLAGYGISDGVAQTGAGVLRSVQVQIKNAAFSESEILIDQTGGKGACHGDSGGPAYINVGGTQMLWGITSRGVNDPKNDCSVASAYTSIPYYWTWIATTAAKLLKQPVSATTPNAMVATSI